MSSVSNTDNSAVRTRVGRPRWYFVVVGVTAGAAVATSALLPPDIYGVAWLAGSLAFSLIDRAVTRSSPTSTRLRRGAVVYVVVVGALLACALVAAAVLVRDSELWVAWAVAVLAFAVFAGGSWIVDRRLSEATARPPS